MDLNFNLAEVVPLCLSFLACNTRKLKSISYSKLTRDNIRKVAGTAQAEGLSPASELPHPSSPCLRVWLRDGHPGDV